MVSCSRGKQSMRPPKCCRVEDVLTLFEKSGEESAGDDSSENTRDQNLDLDQMCA